MFFSGIFGKLDLRAPKIRIQGHMYSDSNKVQMYIAVSFTKGFHMYHHI